MFHRVAMNITVIGYHIWEGGRECQDYLGNQIKTTSFVSSTFELQQLEGRDVDHFNSQIQIFQRNSSNFLNWFRSLLKKVQLRS